MTPEQIMDRVAELAGQREGVEIPHNSIRIAVLRIQNVANYSVWDRNKRKVFSANRSLGANQNGVMNFRRGSWIDDLTSDNRNGLRRVK